MPGACHAFALPQLWPQLRHAVLHQPEELVSIAAMNVFKPAVRLHLGSKIDFKLLHRVGALKDQHAVHRLLTLYKPEVVNSLQSVLLPGIKSLVSNTIASVVIISAT